MNNQRIEDKVNYFLQLVENSKKLSKTEGFSMCREYLIDHYCEPIIIKVNEDFKRDWYNRNEQKLKEQYRETCIELETLYIANIYQDAWLPGGKKTTILAQSLGQLLRDDNTVEDIADYPIEWMVTNL